MKSKLIALTLAAVLLPTTAIAQQNFYPQQNRGFNGPAQVITIAELKGSANFFTERDVILEGTLVRQLSRDHFVFSDGKDQINVELDDDIFLDYSFMYIGILRHTALHSIL